MPKRKRKRKKGDATSRSQKRRRGKATAKAGSYAEFSTLSAGFQALAPKSSDSNVQGALHVVCRKLGRWANLQTIDLNGVLHPAGRRGPYLWNCFWLLPDSITCCKLIDVADVAPVGSAPAAATDTLYSRLRTCNRDGSGTSCVVERMQFLPCEHRHRRVCYDRDHLAALNIFLVGRCALFGLERPKAFCYPVEEEAA